MCAIIGWNGKISNALLRALYRNAAEYGPHAAGLSYRTDDGDLKTFKRAVHPDIFLRNNNHRVARAARFSVGFGHTRYGTHGNNADSNNAHPFTFSKEGKTIVFAHNGVIRNYHSILPSAVVDSEVFGPLIAARDTTPAKGSIGLIWFERPNNDADWQMFVYRRGQNLSASHLILTTGENAILIHSRRCIIDDNYAALRNVSHLSKITIPEGTAYEVRPTGLHPVWADTSVEAPEQEETVCNLATYRGG